MSERTALSRDGRAARRAACVAAVAIAILVLAAGSAQAAPSWWIAKSIDTMKESMDASNQGLTQEQIDEHVGQLAALGASYATVDTPMDRPDVYRMWVRSIRAHGLSVWHRPADWGYPDHPAHDDPDVTPAIYLEHVKRFILDNPDLFAPGDIFDGDSEADGDAYWKRYPDYQWWNDAQPSAACDEFNKYLVDLKTVADEAFREIGVSGVNTGIRSLSDWYGDAKCLTNATIAALGGWLTIDGYYADDALEPALVAPTLIDDALERWHAARPDAKIVMGEYGWSNSCPTDDATQAAVLDAALPVFASKSYVYGLNYWAGAGGEGYGGCTNILTGGAGHWVPRPGAFALARLFGQG
jgi:hypothetical protein